MARKEWPVEVDGQLHTISIEHGENGKGLIRVDGRPAAKPISRQERERTFPVGSQMYMMSCSAAGEVSLKALSQPGLSDVYTGPDFAEPVPSKTAEIKHPALYVPSRVQDLPLSATHSRASFTVPFWAWGILVAVVGGMMFMALGPSYEKSAAKRVEQILTDMALGTGPEVQFAIGIWARNVKALDRDELEWASVQFDNWRREKDLYRKFSSWKVVDSEEVEGEKVPTAIVTVEIEGRTLKMHVPERRRISWID